MFLRRNDKRYYQNTGLWIPTVSINYNVSILPIIEQKKVVNSTYPQNLLLTSVDRLGRRGSTRRTRNAFPSLSGNESYNR